MAEKTPQSPGVESSFQSPGFNATAFEKDMRKLISEVKNKQSDLELKLKKTKGELKNQKKEFITFIGVFVGFITYVSAEIQVLKEAQDIYILFGLSTFLLTALLLFLVILDNIIKEKMSREDFCTPVFKILMVLFVISVGSFILHFFNANCDEKVVIKHQIEKITIPWWLRTRPNESNLSTINTIPSLLIEE